jgi:hypothetical protein
MKFEHKKRIEIVDSCKNLGIFLSCRLDIYYSIIQKKLNNINKIQNTNILQFRWLHKIVG